MDLILELFDMDFKTAICIFKADHLYIATVQCKLLLGGLQS